MGPIRPIGRTGPIGSCRDYPDPVFSPISEILADLRAGKMIVLTDDEGRENEGDLEGAEALAQQAADAGYPRLRALLASWREEDGDRERAEALVQKAHMVCPYSNATRGNIDVRLIVV